MRIGISTFDAIHQKKKRVKDCGKEREGLGGVGGSSDVLWQRCPAAVVVEVEPFLFFDGSSISDCFCIFYFRWSL